MNDESGEESVNNSEPGQNDDGQTTGTTAILGLSPATHFLLQSLPRPGAAMMPEHTQELGEELHEQERTGEGRTVTPPWGGCGSRCGAAASPGVASEQSGPKPSSQESTWNALDTGNSHEYLIREGSAST